jgi:hypothetical protein
VIVPAVNAPRRSRTIRQACRQTLPSFAIGHHVRERRLLDQEKRADFVTARADPATVPATVSAANNAKATPAAAIESAGNQHPPAADPIGAGGEIQRDECRREGRGQQEPVWDSFNPRPTR